MDSIMKYRNESWHYGCRVTSIIWTEKYGNKITIRVECFKPGQSVHSKPVWERLLTMQKSENNIRMLHDRLDSIVWNIVCGNLGEVAS